MESLRFWQAHFGQICFRREWKICHQGREQQFIQVLVAYEKCDFRGIKCAFNDVNDAAFDLDSKQYKELNHILYLKFGISLDNQNKKVIKKIKTILKRDV